MPGTEHNSRYTLAGGLLLCAVTVAVYYPGLGSNFVLDDVNNLGGLGSVSERGILHYLATGFAGPSGRPLSLLSFAVQHGAWPDNPFAFKVVNLFIHLLCGGLIFLICRRVTQYLKFSKREGLFFSFFVGAVWLLHPIQLTTVLYVVQRMTQLSALFVLLGVYLYLLMRERDIQGKHTVSPPVMGLGIWGCTLLAILAKENGILLLLFIPVISSTLLANKPASELKKWNRVILGFPLVIFALYLIVTFESIRSSYGFRPYNMGERLLTEAVVVLDYLKSILL
ncbi:MAG: hypothetical protein WD709_01190, partial [Gammaproteobacteria bacterium]